MGEPSEEELREAYRASNNTDGNAPAAPEESGALDYFPEAKRHTSSAAAWYGLIAPIFTFALVAGVTGSAGWGFLGFCAPVGWWYWQRRRAKVVPRATFRVLQGRLHLAGPAFPMPVTANLDELLDVYLDTETIQRVQERPGPVPELRFINATVGGELDTARVALEFQRETFFLTKERVSHLDSSEWSGKIRRFLRKHGWVPEDERKTSQNQRGGRTSADSVQQGE